MKTEARLFTPIFILLCLSNALFTASFGMILPELPSYLSSLGGEDYKGLIIGLFTLMAGLSRPFSGKLTDTVGRIPVMIFGTLSCVVCSFLYPVLASVGGFLFLRFIHGFSTGFKPTASSAYIADIVPDHRRGEALGIHSVSSNIGFSLGPALGSWLAMVYSLEWMFYCSAVFAIISVLLLLTLEESLINKQPFHWKLLKVNKADIVYKRALPPALVTACVYFTYGVILTIIPDQSDALGIENKGLFFTAFTAASILSRLVAGRISDQYGRVIVLIIAVVLMALSLLFLACSQSVLGFIVGACFIGFSMGIAGPAVFAWAVDLSEADARGKAMSTVYIALEIGIGTGALISAWLYNNNSLNFASVFYWNMLVVSLAFPYLLYRRFRNLANNKLHI